MRIRRVFTAAAVAFAGLIGIATAAGAATQQELAAASVLEEIKKRSSKWIKTKGRGYRLFSWQRGYGAFSIGQSQLAAAKHGPPPRAQPVKLAPVKPKLSNIFEPPSAPSASAAKGRGPKRGAPKRPETAVPIL